MRLAFGLRRVDRDADRRRAVAAAVGEVDRRLVAGHQALVAVGRRVGDGAQGRGVPEQAADGVQGHVGQAGVAGAGEQVLAVLPQRRVDVHAGAVVHEERLGHEGGRLAVLAGDVLDDVLVLQHVVGHLDERGEAHVDLALAAGGDFVVLGLDLEAALDHGQHHLGAQVVQRVGRRARGSSLPCSGACSRGSGFSSRPVFQAPSTLSRK